MDLLGLKEKEHWQISESNEKNPVGATKKFAKFDFRSDAYTLIEGANY
jgi:hypothetical protein